MRYSQWIGVLAAAALMLSGFLNWTWYPDIKKYFTGFFTENNMYGKPAKALIFFAIIAVIFYLLPKVWAKRWNLLVCVIILAFAIRSFIVFSQCYRGICPERQPGIWLMLGSAVVMMLCALLPDLSVTQDREKQDDSAK